MTRKVFFTGLVILTPAIFLVAGVAFTLLLLVGTETKHEDAKQN